MADRKEIRVFISSPSDCQAERDAVSRVLDELNRTVGEREHLFSMRSVGRIFHPASTKVHKQLLMSN